MIRVAISALTLIPGVSGGTESYLRNLCNALREVGRHEYTVFGPVIGPDAGASLGTVVVPSYRASFTTPGRIAAMLEGVIAPQRTGRAIAVMKPDVLHYPLTINTPRVKAAAVVTTIHDLQHEDLPELFSRAERAYRKVAYRDAVRRSDLIIADSEHCRQQVVHAFGVDPHKVRRIYLGIDSQRFLPGSGRRESFIYYPANRWPHKNHDRLFAALELIRMRSPGIRLVLTGSGHDPVQLPANVESLGRVSAERVAELYRSASALVFPSLYEGFGLPVLEAMSSGCPVACSRTASLPEVAGDAAELFDPLDADSIAAAVLRVLESPESYAERGLQRAREFNLQDTAREHDALYAEVAGRARI